MGEAMSPGLSAAVATWYSIGWKRWWLCRSTTVTSDRRMRPALGGVEPAESAAQDHDVRPSAHRPIVSRRQRAKLTTSSTGGTASSLAYAVYMRQRR